MEGLDDLGDVASASASGHGRDEAIDGRLELLDPAASARCRGLLLSLVLSAITIIGDRVALHAIGVEQLAAPAGDDAVFEHGIVDPPPIRAGAGAAGVCAAPFIAAGDDKGADAKAALGDAGQQPLGTPLGLITPPLACGLSGADSVPAFLIDEAHLGTSTDYIRNRAFFY